MVTLEKNINAVKEKLTSEDILTFEFASVSGKKFAVVYADGLIDKQLLGELAIKPLRDVREDATYEEIKEALASPEFKEGQK
ncbi:MAG: hypothetical protein K2K80_00125, partial [Clostridia bacterium]|nr:hypothetical protein [Clostridia bacterium]